jgi:type IV pilus assembly protein PilX|tara:strand:- start:3168 stop:3740 length:573 start_codon:yes stop_codon:yes gene_type:complete
MSGKTKRNQLAGARQQGTVIVFCLVFLAVLTIMGVSGMESTILEERMSGNMRDISMAFQAAESALKEAESWLDTQTTLPTTSTDGSTTVWSEDAMDPAPNDSVHWWSDGARNINAWWVANAIQLNSFPANAANPRYIIEEYHTATSGQSIGIGSGEITRPRVFHRITARGVGATALAEVSVQSTFVRPYD